MQFKFIQVVAAIITLMLLAVTPVVADTSTVRDIWIDGHEYAAVLEENLRVDNARDSDLAGTHYKGHLPEYPGSWVRVSRLDSGWEGLAYVFGRMHAIGDAPRASRVTSFSTSQLEAPQCGLDHLHGRTFITPQSLTGRAMAQAVSASYDTLCANKVDGACLMLELELAFDQQFQDRFPGDFQGRAGAILNMVEGFYADQFGIVFDTLSLTFTGPGTFDSTTDAGTLLDDVTARRGARILPFLESERSIFHLISGRDFAGSTAGLAWVGTVCYSQGYASGITNAYNSNATTAVVIAHEIGHNLGASHDSPDNGCDEGVNIMSPYVVSSATQFSQCSDDAIANRISQLNSVEQCFNFPADAGLTAVSGNPSEVQAQSSFQAHFDIAYRRAAEPADGLVVAGAIGDQEGRLLGVSVGGAACTLLGTDAYDCGEIQARTGLQLSVHAVAGDRPTFSLLQNVSLASNSGDVKDIRPIDDSILTEIAVTDNESGTTGDPDDAEPTSGTPEATGSDSGGGGGGGSVSWWWLVAAVFAAGLRGQGRVGQPVRVIGLPGWRN